jgi:hypothetical protein
MFLMVEIDPMQHGGSPLSAACTNLSVRDPRRV